MIGAVVGNHRIVSRISEGGMGVVYRAEHTMLGRPAAVKVLLPQYSHAREIVARFFNEAKATSAVRHPNIVEIYDFGHLADGQAYIVMEFLDGQTLTQRMHARPMGEGELIHLCRQIASALVSAHDRGIVHRDLKPDNVILVPDSDQFSGVRPKLVDFGIAKLADPGGGVSATRTGAMLGTPTYMSPEQCRGNGAVDHRADIYALGCMMYESIAGRPPFIADGPGEVIAAHLFATPAPLSGGTAMPVSMELERLVMSMLSKRPEDRPQSAAAVGAMLERLQLHAPMAPTSLSMTPVDSAVVRMVMPTPTTLGGAASESRSHVMPPAYGGNAKSHTWLAAGIGVAVATAAIVAMVVLSAGGGGPAGTSAGAAAPAATVRPERGSSASETESKDQVQAAAPAPTPTPTPTPETGNRQPATGDPQPAMEEGAAAAAPAPVEPPAPAPVVTETVVKKPAVVKKPVRKPVRKPTRPKTTGPIENDL